MVEDDQRLSCVGSATDGTKLKPTSRFNGANDFLERIEVIHLIS
jgi:hypothetical protein